MDLSQTPRMLQLNIASDLDDRPSYHTPELVEFYNRHDPIRLTLAEQRLRGALTLTLVPGVF